MKKVIIYFKKSLIIDQPYLQFAEYIFIVGGSYLQKTEVVSLSQSVTELPDCLSNLADHRIEVYFGAGGNLHYESKE